MMLGADQRVTERWTIGGFGGYDVASIASTDGAMNVGDRRYRFGGYATRTGDLFYVDGAFGGAVHSFDGSRHIAFTATSFRRSAADRFSAVSIAPRRLR